MNNPNSPICIRPVWVICHDCGTRYGHHAPGEATTWHLNHCDVCGQLRAVTQPRDYGYPVLDWQARFEKDHAL